MTARCCALSIPAILLSLAAWPVGATDNSTGTIGSTQNPLNAYPGAPAFTVAPRPPPRVVYPCSQCHRYLEPNATPRKLRAPQHPELEHGQGQFWCYTCHSPSDRDQLRTLADVKLGLSDSSTVCGQCHAPQFKDWSFGAHGKRSVSWKDRREIQPCVQCHNPHRPVFQPRKPQPPPPVRAGLERRDGEPPDSHRPWEQPANEPPQ